MSSKAVLLLLLVAVCFCRYNVSLTSWSFTLEGSSKYYPATIPSTLAWDLVENKLVNNDPYYRDNFLQFYEYQTLGATYNTSFTVPSTELSNKYSALLFEGIDTHATVTLNGKQILKSDNMHRTYVVPVEFQSSNQLVVKFQSAAKHDLEKEAEFKQAYQFALPANFSYSRKAAYHYGWDWGPRVASMGIWKEVRAVSFKDLMVGNLKFTHDTIRPHPKTINCELTFDVKFLDPRCHYEVKVEITKGQISLYKEALEIKSTTEAKMDIPFTINNHIDDILWWTWDLGNPNLIDISVSVRNWDDTTQQATASMRTGIRTVKIDQTTNKTTNGTSFTFNLNGYDVYMRGGNYIPPEMSLALTNRQTYQKIKEYAVFGRFNMIRLWGGGQFEKNEFYEMMDEAGILIWHDLMFACAMYPSSNHILQSIEAEMRDNVKRLRHHPSIGLWNGNNQVWIGWNEWGWQKDLNSQQKQLAENMYNDIFQGVLPRVLRQEHPDVYYWETSPSASSNSPRTIGSGDIHFWRVWGAGAPIEEYEEYVGRFNSEYGMQAMPDITTIHRFTHPEDRTIDSQVIRLHERHIKGDVYLPGYTNNYSGTTSNLTRFAYYSQVMQAHALETAIKHLRLNKPNNMGSLYWQLNDVWPGSSWSTVDYYGNYKAGHYTVRHLHEQLLMHTLRQKSEDYAVYITNDYNRTFKCQCTIEIITNRGEATKVKHVVEKTVKPFQRILVRKLLKNEVHDHTHNGIIRTRLTTTDKVSSEHLTFFETPKHRPNLDPELSYKIEGSQLTVSTRNVASYVWIYRRRGEEYIPMVLADNYFTLSPGSSRVVDIGSVPHGEIFVSCYELEVNWEKESQARVHLTQE